MLKKSLIIGAMAGGLIMPARSELYTFPKPAIIKPFNIEFSKNLLAMPLTLGMLAARNNGISLEYIDKTVLNYTSSLGSTVTIDTPSGTQNGDLLLVFTTSSNRTGGHTGTGFTQWFFCGQNAAASGVPKTTILYKILTAAPASTYDFTISGGYGGTAYLAIFTFRPVNGSITIGNFARNTTTPTASTTATAPAVTVTATAPTVGYVFRAYANVDGRGYNTVANSYTNLDNSVNTSGNAAHLVFKEIPSSGAQGTQNATLAVNATSNVASFGITLS